MINSKVKALCAFRKLGAVALITATLAMFFTACKQTSGGGGGGKPTPKHAINFSVDSTTPNGTLKVEGDGITQPATSPINVEQGKEITFTATASDGYRVKGWTLDGKPITEAGTNTEYKLKVSKPATVKVSFEEIPPTKYTVTLTQTEHGKVTASPEIPEDKQVLKDTEITFTAKADDGYKIGTWTVSPSSAIQSGGNKGEATAKVKITADTTVSVSFEANSNPPNPPTPQGTAILTLDPNKLTIKVKAKTEDGSDIAVEGCNETTLKSDTKTELHANGTRVVLKGNIIELDCWSNQLTELNVQGLTNLQKLDCGGNELTSLNVQGLTSLKRLDCVGSELTELNVQGLTALKELWCGNNKLTSLDVQGLTALQDIRCYSNQLTALNVQGCASLQTLSCHKNQLTELNVQGLTSLQVLNCSNNQLTSLNVQDCTSLRRLYCTENKLNAQAMTALLNALLARKAGDNAEAILYTEETDVTEGNCKDYSQPAELKKAFDDAKNRNWKLKKYNASGKEVEI